ncbi:interleukin 21 receptor, tandem duplicate 1 isoform X1 [Pleuronectes platessa]|uniref:interleukin 21 receptor, tandem duplicate 1 isoform X1 n=1 Tax=Pleuronectes platessa TaxID=8262 RepID=UPI00232A5CAB|nr:interleukin 21 receptor, tandem duplicate 1 isoform X1 [Pleuronectes platessa]XP_053287578.1 interleukin 21 receptor, tandem duplicate 1 isoform X1 [Pleuronectes platessa]XP_053287579.1 interleukin 21 receptor, tandem duplicate 1 isoform X1 [Pleuronectes platessa]XP_053287580.1 interleukin 21 receptor, tandem duplicate 1 isoform X1 [Pleuronectes platessa]XP_053287581.1 interleukin 21 receptor, tandem duplicate 1 isoform X1 [Pleuronectes platessa]XP_053287583.1 interleukin 21 receptor, tande
MALKAVSLLLLWEITLLIHCVTSLCNVTCSTDYDVSLNCSCSGISTHPVLVQVSCSDTESVVNGSCEVKGPRSWCVMNPTDLDMLTSVGTNCNATASHQGDRELTQETESSSWALSEVVKPPPPSDVRVTNTDGRYNFSWANHNWTYCLQYLLRIRESKHPSKVRKHKQKAPFPPLLVKSQHTWLYHSKLRPGVNYTVDVQAKICIPHFLQGPWSEWSAAVDWRTEGAPVEEEGMNGYPWLVLIPIITVFGIFLWCFKKHFLTKGLKVVTFIPRANVFFEPLYHEHGGNFKEWVKPIFSEYDYLRMESHVQLMSEKHYDVPQRSEEKKSFREVNEASNGGHLLHVLQPQSSLPPPFLCDGSSQGTGHSAGHVSIHTVTLSGEEYEEEAMSQSSVNTLASYQDGESFGSFEEVDSEHAGYDSEGPQLDGPSAMSPEYEDKMSIELSEVGKINFQPRAEFNEPERISLDSFTSNEQSEDGYPRVDLDTIDSGFAECSSPGASDTAEHMDSDLFQEQKNSNSNYVRQWMICNIIQEDASNSDCELREAQ